MMEGGLRHRLKRGTRDWLFSIGPATFLNLPFYAGRGKGEEEEGRENEQQGPKMMPVERNQRSPKQNALPRVDWKTQLCPFGNFSQAAVETQYNPNQNVTKMFL